MLHIRVQGLEENLHLHKHTIQNTIMYLYLHSYINQLVFTMQ
jgi:hypothetical protein